MKELSMSVTLALIGLSAAWLFRYDYLPPVEHVDVPTLTNRSGRSIITCVADRWTTDVRCDTTEIDVKQKANEMERWLKDRQR